MGFMIARRLTLTTLAVQCALICALAAGVSPAVAGFKFGPLGSEAGQLGGTPSGIAVDRATGDIYVSDTNNNRIDKFDGSGKFVLAWGWGVADGAPELQTCTTSCQTGIEGAGAGQLCLPAGVAVDNNHFSVSQGDVYVVSFCGYEVEKFDPSGKFLLTFGGHVNEATGGNVCVGGEACTSGTQGTEDGEFEWLYRAAYIAVGPSGRVYVGDKARVQLFEQSGAWTENISLSALSSEGKVSALAVNTVGDVFVKDEGVPGVRGFEPGGIEMATKFDEDSEAIQGIALDASDDLFISENRTQFSEPCTCGFLEYSPSGQELESFGRHALVSLTSGMVFDDALNELLVDGTDDESSTEIGHYGIWGFTLPPVGPLVEPGSEVATPELRGSATLAATIDPEGSETDYHFEYVEEASFGESGYASASSTKLVSIGSSFNDQHVEIHLPVRALAPGATYHWRVVATSSQGTAIGPDHSLVETPAAEIEGPWVASLAATSVTLAARIDPLGANTTYQLEYGTGTSYGHAFSGNVGEGMDYAQIGYHIQGLAPGTMYHYRVVTSSDVGTNQGADHTFTTQLAGGELALPDGRAWELVSPPDKKGALIEVYESSDPTQAAGDGSAIVYRTTGPMGEGEQGVLFGAHVISKRSAAGWSARNISTRRSLPPEGESAANLLSADERWPLFSRDLSVGVFEQGSVPIPQSPDATEQTLYLRDNANGSFLPLETTANVPPGTKFGDGQLAFAAGTPDLSHVIFGTRRALTPEAIAETNSEGRRLNLYEWSAGRLQLVNVLSDGKAAEPGVTLGSYEQYGGMTARAVSSDGRRIVWKYGEIASGAGTATLYVRDMIEQKTFRIGGARPRFETMSGDGSKIFYVETENGIDGDLYLFDAVNGTQFDLTAGYGVGEHGARVEPVVMGASEDGSYVYFVAKGVLASGGVSGKDNLYMLHDAEGKWTTTYIATLSHEDESTWRGRKNRSGILVPEGAAVLSRTTSRVSPNGRYVAFMSSRPLTGYDNVDAVSGQPDEEVYLYDAVSKRLVCTSCDPTGARPVGVFDSGEGLLVDRQQAWTANASIANHWLAGNIPGWDSVSSVASYQTRYLSDEGRLFFDSPDALVPQDTNGLEDVYQYEPAGVGSCVSGDPSFNERSQGCVSLLSSGISASESAFMDASENGDDLFFVTASKLTADDYDTSYDLYDAHVCSAGVPCRRLPVSPPPCTSGDSCKAAPSPQPEIFGPAPSATFSGVGNVVEGVKGVVKSKKHVVKHKRKTKRHVKRVGGTRRSRNGKTSRKGNG
jgi:hypothetical protein